MKQKDRQITRRDFLRGATYATVAVTMGIPSLHAEENKPATKTKVILIREKGATGKDSKPDGKVVVQMLDKAVMELFGGAKPLDAWKQVVKPDDIVGIKSNVWGPLPTPAELEKAIKSNVLAVGVKEKNIEIGDRGILNSKVFTNATALINIRPMRTHHWSGVGGLLKNYIMFVPRPDDYHDDSCADLAALWKLPIVKGKTRLNVLVMLTPLFHGVGPHHFDAQYTWRYNGLLVGTDPVALDALGVAILNAHRKEHFGKERRLKPPAHHVVYADIRHKLGTSNLDEIELVKLGWQEGALI